MKLIRESLYPRFALCVCLVALIFGCISCVSEETAEIEIIETAYGVEMVVLPGGWFEMGDEANADCDAPAHKVWVDSFYMDRYEVTQDLYFKLQISDSSRFEGENLPVEQKTWIDAVRFCNIRSYEEGLELCYDEDTLECNFEAGGYRLPTEAEWEYACRAGTTSSYSYGDDPNELSRYAWFNPNAGGKTQTIGSRRPNSWGLFDMHGNVAEWCSDYYSEDYYSISPERNPSGPVIGELRVIRGGAWNSTLAACRSGYRTGSASVDDGCLISDAIGFRCVRNIPDK
ncbi:formylglycine-generating enzyme family protein [Acidobacteriota bacterium]